MVTPFKSNPEQFALYKLMQDGTEVGWVYARGEVTTNSGEVWQLYTNQVTGAGRGAYMWPSYQDTGSEGTSVTLQFVYVRSVDSVGKPDSSFTHGTEYVQVSAPITSP